MISMINRVLICYGTRYGSAGEIAERIAEIIRERGVQVDVANLKEKKIKDITDYDLVVIGSGIQMGRWTKEPLKFLKKNREVLSQKEVAVYVSCASAAQPDQCEQAQNLYLEKTMEEFPEISPIALGLFGGLLDPSRGGRMTRRILETLVKTYTADGEPVDRVDLRDWEKIEEWAQGLIRDPFAD
ncbi:MAG: flavodoxin domain-containing protein [Candidatus Hodarchaeota archaeon]